MTSIAVENITRWNDGHAERVTEQLATEEPLEIRVRGRAITVTMRTPGDDADLAAGFLLTEGIVRSRADILEMQPCTLLAEDGRENNVLNVLLAPEVAVDFGRLTRHLFAGSSCGICGKGSIDAVRSSFAPVNGGVEVGVRTLLDLPRKMREAQRGFDATGGIHAAALFDRSGNLIVAREDVGRHNAVDKVIGHWVMNGARGETPGGMAGEVLMVSGRTSFEILQKALAARIAIVAAVSAPSSLAVEFAREMGQTLIGFLREKRMNIYTHAERVRL